MAGDYYYRGVTGRRHWHLLEVVAQFGHRQVRFMSAAGQGNIDIQTSTPAPDFTKPKTRQSTNFYSFAPVDNVDLMTNYGSHTVSDNYQPKRTRQFAHGVSDDVVTRRFDVRLLPALQATTGSYKPNNCFRTFAMQVEKQLRLMNIPREDWTRFLGLLLGEDANTYFLPSEIDDICQLPWTETVNKMSDRLDGKSKANYRAEAERFKQQDLPVLKYMAEKRILIHKSSPYETEDVICRQILVGMNEDLRRRVENFRPAYDWSLKELQDIASRYELQNQERREQAKERDRIRGQDSNRPRNKNRGGFNNQGNRGNERKWWSPGVKQESHTGGQWKETVSPKEQNGDSNSVVGNEQSPAQASDGQTYDGREFYNSKYGARGSSRGQYNNRGQFSGRANGYRYNNRGRGRGYAQNNYVNQRQVQTPRSDCPTVTRPSMMFANEDGGLREMVMPLSEYHRLVASYNDDYQESKNE